MLSTQLSKHRHLRDDYVLCLEDGQLAPGHMLRDWLEAVQRRAGLSVIGGLHKLRHTFCSHLAKEGTAAKAIQELAGHTDLTQTMRYMHLSPGSLDAAIALLNVQQLSYAHLTHTVGGTSSK
jgi:site-specific recombinase XerD